MCTAANDHFSNNSELAPPYILYHIEKPWPWQENNKKWNMQLAKTIQSVIMNSFVISLMLGLGMGKLLEDRYLYAI